jgi:SprT protein
MNRNKDPKLVFQKHFPENVADYAFQLWQENTFFFKITRSRTSKLGDFRYSGKDKPYQITVNGDLHPFQFTITYLHEVAHLLAHKKFGNKIDPHGHEWKSEFKALMLPVVRAEVFPPALKLEVIRHFQNPKASVSADPRLQFVLRRFTGEQTKPILSEIRLGQKFEFQQRIFTKLEDRRTRVLCLEEASQRKYLISKVVEVDLYEDK